MPFDVVDTQMWVLERVADLVIDLERPFIVKEIGIEPFLGHVAIVIQVTTDDYVTCPQVDALRRRNGAVHAIECVQLTEDGNGVLGCLARGTSRGSGNG